MDAVDFTEDLIVRLPHTDAAGVLFYPRVFDFEEELFERWLELGGFSLRAMLERTLAPTPIVHCEADYRSPVRTGDRLIARLSGVSVGRSGYTLAWTFTKDGEVSMHTKVTRVAIDAELGESIDLPESLREWLESTQARVGSLD